MGSFKNILAENTVKIGEVAVRSEASDKGRCWNEEKCIYTPNYWINVDTK